jgi:hypothetical protein
MTDFCHSGVAMLPPAMLASGLVTVHPAARSKAAAPPMSRASDGGDWRSKPYRRRADCHGEGGRDCDKLQAASRSAACRNSEARRKRSSNARPSGQGPKPDSELMCPTAPRLTSSAPQRRAQRSADSKDIHRSSVLATTMTGKFIRFIGRNSATPKCSGSAGATSRMRRRSAPQ